MQLLAGTDPEHLYGEGGILNKISLKALLAKQCRMKIYLQCILESMGGNGPLDQR